MGRGYSKSRSHSGRLPNKVKRGVRSLQNLSERTNQIRTRSEREHEADEITGGGNKGTTASSSSNNNAATSAFAAPSSKDQKMMANQEDAGRGAHRNIVAQVRARSALMRQRVLSADSRNQKKKILSTAALAAEGSSKKQKNKEFLFEAQNGDNDDDDDLDSDGIDFDDDDLASEPDEERISHPEVLAKYKASGRITDEVVRRVIEAAIPGASVFTLCNLGDELMETMCKTTYSKAKDPETNEPLKRGICVPTNVSLNNVLCHNRPLSGSLGGQIIGAGDQILRVGDVVKIHLGCHIDGYSTSAAHTMVVVPLQEKQGINLQQQQEEDDNKNNNNNNNNDEKVSSGDGDEDAAPEMERQQYCSKEASNAISCAHHAMTAFIRGMRIGAFGSDLTNLLKTFASNYNVEACEGVLSNRTKRWILDGTQCIINRRVFREEPQQDVGEVEVTPFQIWTLDVAFTTGQTYKLTSDDATIFRRNELPTPPQMRVRSAEKLLSEIRDRFLCYPFCPTMSENSVNNARLGVTQLQRAGVIDPCPPIRGHHRAVTTRASCTIAITDKRIHILSGAPFLDQHASYFCDELAPTLVEFVSKPLSFSADNINSSSSNNKQQQQQQEEEQEGEQEQEEISSALIDADADATTTKNKEFVQKSMSKIPRGVHTSNQIQSMLPPGAKRKQQQQNQNQNDDDAAAATTAVDASSSSSKQQETTGVRNRSSEGGRRSKKEHRAE